MINSKIFRVATVASLSLCFSHGDVFIDGGYTHILSPSIYDKANVVLTQGIGYHASGGYEWRFFVFGLKIGGGFSGFPLYTEYRIAKKPSNQLSSTLYGKIINTLYKKTYIDDARPKHRIYGLTSLDVNLGIFGMGVRLLGGIYGFPSYTRARNSGSNTVLTGNFSKNVQESITNDLKSSFITPDQVKSASKVEADDRNADQKYAMDNQPSTMYRPFAGLGIDLNVTVDIGIGRVGGFIGVEKNHIFYSSMISRRYMDNIKGKELADKVSKKIHGNLMAENQITDPKKTPGFFKQFFSIKDKYNSMYVLNAGLRVNLSIL